MDDDNDDKISNKKKKQKRRKRRYNTPSTETEYASLLMNENHVVDSSREAITTTAILSNNVDNSLTISPSCLEEEKEEEAAPTVTTNMNSNIGRRRSRRKRKRRIKNPRQLQQQQKEDDDDDGGVVVDNDENLNHIFSSLDEQSILSKLSTAVNDQVDNNNNDFIDIASNNPSSEIIITSIKSSGSSASSSSTLPRTKSRKKRRQRIIIPSNMAMMTTTDNVNDDNHDDDSKEENTIASIELEEDNAIIASSSSTLTLQMEDAMYTTDIFKHGKVNEDVGITMMVTNMDDENNDVHNNIIMNNSNYSSIVLSGSKIIPRDDDNVSNTSSSSVINNKELNIQEIDNVDDIHADVKHYKEVKLDSIVKSNDEATISSFIIKGVTNIVDADDVSVLNETLDVVHSEPNSMKDGKDGIDDNNNFESSLGGTTTTNTTHESGTVGGESITLEEETFSTATTEMVDTIVVSSSISKEQDDKCKSMNDVDDDEDDETLKEETNDDDSLTLSIVTWNLGESEPSMEDALTFFNRFCNNNNSHLIMIGAQECEDIKPRRTEGRRSRHFRRLCIMMLGEDYVPLAIHSLGGIQCALYCHRNVLGEVDMIDVADVTCGVGGVFHNKGAIGIYLKMKRRGYDNEMKSTSKTSRILLITGHLAAHVTNVDARNADYKRIVSELETQAPIRFLHPRRKNADGSLADCDGTHLLNSMDHVFFAGDLNYRIDLPREYVEQCIINIQRYRQTGAIDHANLLMTKLLRQDQLVQTIASGRAFTNFCEGKVTFLPTFKFDKGTSDYDTSHKQRIPAWTDRIVFRSNKINVLEYDSAPEAMHSDHRPVFGTFKLGWGIKDTISVSSKRKLKRTKSMNRG
jgi:phosphatidylinositol-bisphosphatase